MLLEQPYKIDDVVTVKLASGEELVGKLVGEYDDGSIKLKTPLTLVASQQGLGLQQFLFTGDPEGTIKIGQNAITVMTKTVDNFAKLYTERTTGLATPPPNLQVK
jgi:hypothetical protein